ncbi:MAG: pilus assembly protein PilM [Planctomycetes bacterium]|nr:pilus assembly protein PilM [Planctomycetota bacterium]
MTLGVGLDIGGSSVTVAAVRARKGSLALERFLHVPLDELAGEGVDTSSPGEVARAVAGRMRDRGVPTGRVVVGVSGRDAIIRYSHLPQMPAWRLALLVQYEVQDTAEKTGEALSADYRLLPNAGDGNLVLVALAKDARVLESIRAWQAAGVGAVGAMPLPVATGDCARFLCDEAAAGTTLVVDVGRDATEVALVETGELIFARSVQTGGEAFTERAAKLLGLDRDEAEEKKRLGELDDGVLDGPRQQLAAMVSASIDFARGQLKRKKLKVDRVLLTGGGARVPGLVEAVGRAAGCEARLFDPLDAIDLSRANPSSRDAAAAAGLEATTALGLALSAVLPHATRLDLLPLEVKRALERRHRTVPLVVAGAALVLALVLAFGTALWARSGEEGRRAQLQAARAQVTARLQQHRERARLNEAREAELRALADRARPGLALAGLLGTLGERLPARVSLSKLALVRDDRTGGFGLELEGTADNAQGDGIEAMRQLQQALEADPLVAEASVKPRQHEGATLDFTVTVVPTGGAAAPPAADQGGD